MGAERQCVGIICLFHLGVGATYPVQLTRGRRELLGATGAVNVVATNAATFYVTGVKLEIGSVATPSIGSRSPRSMADCQRYYQAWTNNLLTQGIRSGGSVHL